MMMCVRTLHNHDSDDNGTPIDDDDSSSRTSSSYLNLYIYLSSHLSLNHEGRWGTTDDFATSFLHFSLFSTALWKLANSRPVHSLMSSHLFLCLPCLLSPFNVPCKMVLARLMNGRHDHSIAVGVSLRWSGGLRVARLPSGFWHGLPCW